MLLTLFVCHGLPLERGIPTQLRPAVMILARAAHSHLSFDALVLEAQVKLCPENKTVCADLNRCSLNCRKRIVIHSYAFSVCNSFSTLPCSRSLAQRTRM
jgi:hypothetical protein